jgi:hypothetical protein
MYLQIRCAAGTCRYYVVAQKTLPYPICYTTGVPATSPEKAYLLALQSMRQGRGEATVHSGIPGSKRKYYVGNNWAYNINSSVGSWDETHKFSEIAINGTWWLIIKPIRERITMPGQEIKVWYPWKKFIITTYLSDKDRQKYTDRETRLKRQYPYIRRSDRI